jgi:hypothetical protein
MPHTRSTQRPTAFRWICLSTPIVMMLIQQQPAFSAESKTNPERFIAQSGWSTVPTQRTPPADIPSTSQQTPNSGRVLQTGPTNTPQRDIRATGQRPNEVSASEGSHSTTFPDQFPPSYGGDNVIQIKDAMMGIDFNRGQFEKTTEYNERLLSYRSRNVTMNKTLESIFHISMPFNFYGLRYNPDREEIYFVSESTLSRIASNKDPNVTVPIRDVLWGLKTSIDIKSDVEEKVGTTAMGARRVFTEYDLEYISVFYCTVRRTPIENTLNPITMAVDPRCERSTTPNYKISAPPRLAKSMMDDMRIVMAGRVSDLFMSLNIDLGTPPTLSDPTRFRRKVWQIYFDPTEFAIYSFSSGRIYARIRVGP